MSSVIDENNFIIHTENVKRNFPLRQLLKINFYDATFFLLFLLFDSLISLFREHLSVLIYMNALVLLFFIKKLILFNRVVFKYCTGFELYIHEVLSILSFKAAVF